MGEIGGLCSHTPLCAEVDCLRRLIRAGNFTNQSLLDKCWKGRRAIPEDDVHRTRIHTLSWEAYDARGEYPEARTRLLEDGVVTRGIEKLENAVRNADTFVAQHFACAHDDPAQIERYNVWRQRVIGALAYAVSEFRSQGTTYEGVLNTVELFLEQCFAKAGYANHGTRARLNFFRGNIFESKSEIAAALAAYERSLECLSSRVKHRLTNTPERSTERDFATYCLGKLELRMGQIYFHRGLIQRAQEQALKAGMLLAASQDPYLPHMAELLSCQIERYREDFKSRGWEIAARLCSCCHNLDGHKPYQLKAVLEWTKTCVYLYDTPTPRSDPAFLNLEQALAKTNEAIDEAQTLNLRKTHCQALLIKARTMLRMGRATEATEAVKQADNLLRALPNSLKAEALFVKGKIESMRARRTVDLIHKAAFNASAAELFRQALDLRPESVTFRATCLMQIVEALNHQGKVVQAGRFLIEAETQLSGIERTFLNVRLRRLREQKAEAGVFYHKFEPGDDVGLVKERLVREYVSEIASQMQIEPEFFSQNFAKIRGAGWCPKDWKWDKMETLLKSIGVLKQANSKPRSMEP
jgi:tetratricopeptide (TPR) repeat protein